MREGCSAAQRSAVCSMQLQGGSVGGGWDGDRIRICADEMGLRVVLGVSAGK